MNAKSREAEEFKIQQGYEGTFSGSKWRKQIEGTRLKYQKSGKK